MDEDMAKHPALRPVGPAARYAVVALYVAGAAWVARAGWEIRLAMAGEPASGLPDQGGGVHRPSTALEDAYHVVQGVSFLVMLFCGVLFVHWLWRVRDNARVLSGRPPKYAGIWVYLGWVLPIANLWVPRGLVADVYRGCVPGARLPWVVNVWWGLWLVGQLGGVGFLRTSAAAGTDAFIARAYTDVWPLLASDAAVVGAAVAAAFVVRTVTAAQQQSLAMWSAGGWAPAAV